MAVRRRGLLVPSLAPIAAVIGVEAAAALAASFAPKVISRGPLVLTKRDPYRPVGDNWATRAGRRAHKFYEDMANAKPGWSMSQRCPDPKEPKARSWRSAANPRFGCAEVC